MMTEKLMTFFLIQQKNLIFLVFHLDLKIMVFLLNLLKEEHYNLTDITSTCDPHPNEVGHKFIANILSNWMIQDIIN